MTQRKKRSGIARNITVAAAAAAALSAASPVQANNVIDEIGHFLECFGWMLTDPAKQIEVCGKGSTDVGLGSLSTPVDGPAYVAPVVVVPEEEEPCSFSC
jgi:hypothetical protein